MEQVAGARLNKLTGFLRSMPERLGRRLSARAEYRPEIDGLRFVAIAVVLIGHLAERVGRFQTPAGGLTGWEATVFRLLASPGPGVMLFLSISSLVITRQFLSRDAPPLTRGFLRSYFMRRALRIEPPYLLLLCVSFLVVSVLGVVPERVHQFHGEPKSLNVSFLASLVYAHGWLFGSMPRLFSPGWTLEVEVQFYVLAPLLFHFYFFERDPGRRRLQFWGLMAASLSMALACCFEPFRAHLQYTILRFAVYFVVGSGFAIYQTQVTEFVRKLPRPVVDHAPWLGIGLLVLPEGLWPGAGWREALRTLLQVAAVPVLIASVYVDQSAFKRLCCGRWVGLLGAACYSLYLTHLQLLHLGADLLSRLSPFDSWWLAFLVDGALLLPLVLVVGLAFYALVERPFMNPHWPRRAWCVLRRISPARQAHLSE